jgi:hypothetical protein
MTRVNEQTTKDEKHHNSNQQQGHLWKNNSFFIF